MEGFKIRLNTRAAAGVGTGDGQGDRDHAFLLSTKYLGAELIVADACEKAALLGWGVKLHSPR
jgi:hypothetical protein